MKTPVLIAFLLASSAVFSYGQQQNLDSLAAVVKKLPDSEQKASRLQALAEQYLTVNIERSLSYYHQSYALAKQLQADALLPELELAIGRSNANTGRLDSALYYFKLAQTGFEQQNQPERVAFVLTRFRWVYNSLGDLEKANDYSFQALKIFEALDDQEGIALTYYTIGENLYYQEKMQEALKYAEQAYEIQRKLDAPQDLAATMQSLAEIWLQIGDFDTSLKYCNEGLSLRKQLKNETDIALSLNSRGNTYKYMKRYDKALEDYQASLAMSRAAGFTALEMACLGNIGHVYNLQGAFAKALPYHRENRSIIVQTDTKDLAVENLEALAEAFAGVGRFDSAYHYQTLHSELSSEILNENNSRSMTELQTKYETAQKEAKIAVQESKLRQSNIRFYAVLAGLVFALGVGFILYRLTVQLRQRNREKEYLVKEIHHRVQNNLQVLSSLLHLQSRQIQNEAALDAVREGQNRVEAMGLLHQKLYMGDNLAAVEMREYLSGLGEILLDSFGIDDERVKIIYHVPELRLDIDTAIPIGLIFNELMTNSMKYAFPNQQQGIIEIRLERTAQGKLYLSVSDDGVGKSAAPEGTSFGTNLVEMLSKKLKGTPYFPTVEQGYSTVIEFGEYRAAS